MMTSNVNITDTVFVFL